MLCCVLSYSADANALYGVLLRAVENDPHSVLFKKTRHNVILFTRRSLVLQMSEWGKLVALETNRAPLESSVITSLSSVAI